MARRSVDRWRVTSRTSGWSRQNSSTITPDIAAAEHSNSGGVSSARKNNSSTRRAKRCARFQTGKACKKSCAGERVQSMAKPSLMHSGPLERQRSIIARVTTSRSEARERICVSLYPLSAGPGTRRRSHFSRRAMKGAGRLNATSELRPRDNRAVRKRGRRTPRETTSL